MSKISIIGEGYTGKSTLLNTYFTKTFTGISFKLTLDEFDPTIVEDYREKKENRNGKEFLLTFSDELGGRGGDYLNDKILSRTHFIILCFSVVQPDSFERIRYWHDLALRFKHANDVPLILVATKIDLRSDPKTLQTLDDKCLKPINKEEGEKMAKEIRALAYFETSAKNMIGVDDAFQTAIDLCFKVNEGKGTNEIIKKKKNCLVQ